MSYITRVNEQKAKDKAVTPEAPRPAEESGEIMEMFANGLRRMASFGEGILDPIYGASQMLENTVEEIAPGVADWVNEKDAQLYDATDGMLGKPRGVDVDEQLRRREEAYEREYAPVGGADALRVGGNIVPAVLAAPTIAAGTSLPATAAILGAEGAIGGSVMPQTGEGDYWDQVAEDALVGGLTAGVGGAALNKLGSAVTGQLNRPGMGVLKEAGVQPTVGQALGGIADTAEQRLTSVPLLGDAISNARRRAAGELREAAFREAGDAVGATVNETGTAGVQALQDLSQQAYDDLTKFLPEMNITSEFAGSFDNIIKEAGEAAYDTPSLREGRKFIDEYIKPKVGSGKLMPDEIKELDSMLKRRISKAKSEDAREIFSDIRSQLMGGAAEQSPEFAEQLAKADELYAKKSIIQKASQSAEEFTPAQLDNAVKANDKAYGGGRNANNYTAGRGPLRELSKAGRDVLGDTVPDSGSAGRVLTGMGALGGGGAMSGTLVPVLAGAAAGGVGSTRIGQKGIVGLLDVLAKGGEKVGQEGFVAGGLLSQLMGDE